MLTYAVYAIFAKDALQAETVKSPLRAGCPAPYYF